MASVLSDRLSPRRSKLSRATDVTRFKSSRRGSRGSAASTTSPGRGRRYRRATRRRSPGRSVGAIDRPRTSTTSSQRRAARRAAAAAIQISARGRIGSSGWAPADPGLLRSAGGLPHLVDRVDHREQLLGRAGVERLLHLRGLLGGLPEGLVEIRVLLEVLGLEVVVPEDVEVMLDELGALLLDMDTAGLEEGVVT